MLTNLLLTVTPSLIATECPFGTERFAGRSDCESLQDYCTSLNKIVSEDGLDCGDLCKYNEKELFSMKAFHKCPAKDHHLRMRLNVLAPLFDVRAQNQQRGFFGLYLSI